MSSLTQQNQGGTSWRRWFCCHPQPPGHRPPGLGGREDPSHSVPGGVPGLPAPVLRPHPCAHAGCLAERGQPGCTDSSGGPGQGLAAVEEEGWREGRPDPLGVSPHAQGCAPLTGGSDYTPGWAGPDSEHCLPRSAAPHPALPVGTRTRALTAGQCVSHPGLVGTAGPWALLSPGRGRGRMEGEKRGREGVWSTEKGLGRADSADCPPAALSGSAWAALAPTGTRPGPSPQAAPPV